jgi:hypothetical protein
MSGRKPSGIRNLLKKLRDEPLEDKLRRVADEGGHYSHQALRPNFMQEPCDQYTIKTPRKFLTNQINSNAVQPRNYVKRASIGVHNLQM